MIDLQLLAINQPSNILYRMFKNINLLEYEWKINTEEILYDDNKQFFEKDVLTGHEFLKCILRDSYYMIFADIKAYPVGSEKNSIVTYDDYLNSDCQIIILCVDTQFIDFYCKDKKIICEVYKNCCSDDNFEQISILTSENDSRTRMSVW